MRIAAVQNFHITPVTFGARNPVKNYGTYPISNDIYTKNENNLKINDCYENIRTQVGIYSAEDIVGMANRISDKTDVSVDDVYIAMGMLSQYSSYKSLKDIKKYLDDNEISLVANIVPYNINRKHNFSPCLTNVMHYISLKNYNFANDSSSYKHLKKALFWDFDLAKNVNNLSENEKSEVYNNCLLQENIKNVYIENFENGYNFLNQGEDFEQFVTEKIEKAKLISENNNIDIASSMDYLLNAKTVGILNKSNIDYDIIPAIYSSNPKDIADNLNPIIPSKREFASVIDDISTKYSVRDEEYNKNISDITDFINNMNFVISPKQYCNYLKEIKNDVDKILVKNGKTQDDIYYLIPARNKSFIIANYQYQKINNIKNPKNIYIDGSAENYINLKNKIKPNSVILFLDDCAMSGLSFTRDIFAYGNIQRFIPRSNNVNFIFAPIVGSNIGLKQIEKVRKQVDREDMDAIVCPKILSSCNDNLSDNSILIKNYTKQEREYITSLILPYMGPDSNSEYLVPFYEKFFISPNAQKFPVDSFSFVSDPVYG